MKRIKKLISSALHNSSANEAATALKMAAANMQKLGINPADLLRLKVDEDEDRHADNTAEVNGLKRKINALEDDLHQTKRVAIQCKREADLNALKLSNLRDQYAIATNNLKAANKSIEALATVKVESRELAREVLNLNAKVKEQQAKLEKAGNRFWLQSIITLALFLAIGSICYDNGKHSGAALVRNQQLSPQTPTPPKLTPADPTKITLDNKAVCYSDFRTAQGKVLAKITYNNHELSFYARKLKDKAWIDISPQVFKDEQTRQVPYDAQGFIEVSKKDAAEIKSKVECTLGAIS